MRPSSRVAMKSGSAGRPRRVGINERWTPPCHFDCNVFLQSLFNQAGPSRACVVLAQEHQVTLILSDEIISEAREVLGRHFVQRKRPGVTQQEIDELLDVLIYAA